jgi:hypothetical protein
MKLSQETSLNFLHYCRFILPSAAAAVLLVVLAVGWYAQPDRYVRGYAPSQPIHYSHKLHAGRLKIPCQYCHSNVLKSRQAGIPAVEKCMNCHRVTKTDRPPIRQLSAVYTSGRPLLWQRIHSLPNFVFFDHRPHIHTGILCQTCHGEVETMEVNSQRMSLRMANCLGCHRNPQNAVPADDSIIKKGPETCNACHQ